MRKILISLALILATSSGALADEITDRVIASLRAQGYIIVEMSRTWLGRMWILAQNGTYRREIVFNPGTGEVLRDYSVALATLDAKSRLANIGETHSTPGTVPIQPNVVAGDPIVNDPVQFNDENYGSDGLLGDPNPYPAPLVSSEPPTEYNVQVVPGPEE